MNYGFDELYHKLTETFGKIEIDLEKDNLYMASSARFVLTASWRKEDDKYNLRLKLNTVNRGHQTLVENIPVSFIDEEENIHTGFFNSEGTITFKLPQDKYHLRFWKLHKRELDEIYKKIIDKYERKKFKPEYEGTHAYYEMHAIKRAYKKQDEKGYVKEEEGKKRSYLKIGTDLYSFGYIKNEEKKQKINTLQEIMKKEGKESEYQMYELDKEDRLWEIQ